MLLTLGLPAVAAATHGHEFSTEHQATMDQQHGFLHPLQFLNNQLSALTTFTYGSSHSASPANDHSPSPASDELEAATHHEDHDGHDYDGVQGDDNSVKDAASSIGSKRKSLRKTTTSFQLAYPPPAPKLKKRWKGRSRVLLQLRQISATRSPVPAFEVLPSALFGHRLMRRCPRAPTCKISLGGDDLVIVKSQMHLPTNGGIRADEDSEEESGANRPLLAVISPPGNEDHAHIWLEGDETWIASSMANGGYEFTFHDEHGLKTTARWVVPKPSTRRRGNSNPTAPSASEPDSCKKFKFSILNPLARRHPVVASMDRYGIDVLNQYNSIPSPSATPTMNTPRTTCLTSPQQSYFSTEIRQANTVNDVDDKLRRLVLVTGIWVAFVEGWSKYNADSGNSTSTVNTNSAWVNRTASGRLAYGNGSRVGTPQSLPSSRSRHPSFGGLHRATASTNSTPIPQRLSAPLQRTQSTGSPSGSRTVRRNPSLAETQKEARKRVAMEEQIHEMDPVRPSWEDATRNLVAWAESHPLEDDMGVDGLHIYRDEEEDESAKRIKGTSNGQERDGQKSRRKSGDTSRSRNVDSTSMEATSKKAGKVNRLLNYIGKKKKRG